MRASTEWQLDRGAAELYESILVPSILGPVAGAFVDGVPLNAGGRVLDVGCGTGAASRCAAERVGPQGTVVGVDVNRGMLEVARSLPRPPGAPVEWIEGGAVDLPVDGPFDAVLIAQTLQFLPDRPAALSQARRVLGPGGLVAASVWSELERNPYFHALVESMSRNVGPQTAGGLRAAFGLSDEGEISRLVHDAGFQDVHVREVSIELELPPVRDFVPRHVGATPMSVGFGAATREAREGVLEEMELAMNSFRVESGVRVPFRTRVVTGTR